MSEPVILTNDELATMARLYEEGGAFQNLALVCEVRVLRAEVARLTGSP